MHIMCGVVVQGWGRTRRTAAAASSAAGSCRAGSPRCEQQLPLLSTILLFPEVIQHRHTPSLH